MEHINFNQRLKMLNGEIIKAIIDLMKAHDVTEVDLLGSNAPHAFVSGYYGGYDTTEMEVSKVYLSGDKLELDVILDSDDDEQEDISDLYQVFDAADTAHIIPCSGISDVYETIYEILEYGK